MFLYLVGNDLIQGLKLKTSNIDKQNQNKGNIRFERRVNVFENPIQARF